MPNPNQSNKDRKTYDNINDNYLNKTFSIDKACKQEGITTMTYYRICKRLGLSSVGANCKIITPTIVRNIYPIKSFTEQSQSNDDITSISDKQVFISDRERARTKESEILSGGRRNKNLVVEKIFKKDKKINCNSINEEQRTDKLKNRKQKSNEDDNNSDEEFFRKCRSAAGI